MKGPVPLGTIALLLCLGITSTGTRQRVWASGENEGIDNVRLVRMFLGDERIEHLSRSNGVYADIGGAKYFNAAILVTVRLSETEGTDLEVKVGKSGGKAYTSGDMRFADWDMRLPDVDLKIPNLDMRFPDWSIRLPSLRLPGLRLPSFRLGAPRGKVSRVDRIDLPDSQGGKVIDAEKQAKVESQGGKSVDKAKIDAPDKNGAKVVGASKIESPKTIKGEAREIKVAEPEEPKHKDSESRDEEKPRKPEKSDCKVIDGPSDAGKITKELISKSETTAKYRLTFAGKRGKNETLCVFDRLHPDLDLEAWSCSEEVQFYADDSTGAWFLGWEIAAEKLPKQIVIEYTVRLSGRK